jgi:hypothetical protein
MNARSLLSASVLSVACLTSLASVASPVCQPIEVDRKGNVLRCAEIVSNTPTCGNGKVAMRVKRAMKGPDGKNKFEYAFSCADPVHDKSWGARLKLGTGKVWSWIRTVSGQEEWERKEAARCEKVPKPADCVPTPTVVIGNRG